MYQTYHFVNVIVSFVFRCVLCVPIFSVTRRTQRIAQRAQSVMDVVIYDRLKIIM